MRARIWTAMNAVMLLAFAFSAAVQVNDPDPLAWIAIYLAATLLCGFELTRRIRPVFPILLSVVALAWASTIAPRVIGIVPFTDMFADFEMQNVAIEEAREMYGLLLVALWMAVVAVAARRRRARPPGSAQRPQRSQHGVGVP